MSFTQPGDDYVWLIHVMVGDEIKEKNGLPGTWTFEEVARAGEGLEFFMKKHWDARYGEGKWRLVCKVLHLETREIYDP